MNETESYTRNAISSSVLPVVQESNGLSSYDLSLVGEFARILLVLIATPLWVWFVRGCLTGQNGILFPITTTLLLVSLVTTFGSKTIRTLVLALLTINIFSGVVSTTYLGASESKKIVEPPEIVLLVSISIALIFECGGLLSSCSRKTRGKFLAWGTLTVPALLYIFAGPLIEPFWQQFKAQSSTTASVDPNWTYWNEATFRTAQFGVFAVFTFAGACLGSFLNVVAYCLPRGESVAFRDSTCPVCNAKIKRSDNIPIFSYINLGARCRDCSVWIPPRYLIVEIVVAFIFGSLFVYELVTGCTNVPFMRVHYKGILWVILYPKWPAIAIYFYHACLMSAILVLALIEWDRQAVGHKFAWMLTGIFGFASLIYWPIAPVPVWEPFPLALSLAPAVEQVLKVTIGGVAGIGLAILFGGVVRTTRNSCFRYAMIWIGIVLGWQALLQITMLFTCAFAVSQTLPKFGTWISQRPTAVLLSVIILHQPFWKTVFDWWAGF